MIIEKIQDPETFKKENEKKFYSNSVPLTKGEGEGLLSRALIFDSVYDTYK